MRILVWFLLYFGAAALSWFLFLVGLGAGIGGCDDCSRTGYRGLCWFCSELGQIAYLVLAASPLWGLALLQAYLRARPRRDSESSQPKT